MEQTLSILSAGAPKGGVRLCLDAFEKARGVASNVTFATAPRVGDAVRNGSSDADLVVAPLDAISSFKVNGLTLPAAGGPLGSVAAGVVIRSGAPAPDIYDVDTLCQALRAADAIIYNTASSGAYIESMIGDLGLAAYLADKTIRPENGAAVMSALVEFSGVALGFAQIPEIRNYTDQGVTLVGPLPDAVAHVTTYGVAVLKDARDVENAIALANFMASNAAADLLDSAGITRL